MRALFLPLLLCLATPAAATGTDAGPGAPKGPVGVVDAGVVDAGVVDAAVAEAGGVSTGMIDGGVVIDAGPAEAGSATTTAASADPNRTLDDVRAAQSAFADETATIAAVGADLHAGWAKRLVAHRERLAASTGPIDLALARELVSDLTALRQALDDTVTAVRVGATAPRPAPSRGALGGLDGRDQGVADHLVREAARLEAERTRVLMAHASQAARVLEVENALRLTVLSRLGPADRALLIGFTDEGFAQARRELHHAAVVARFLWFVEVPSLQGRAAALGGLQITRLLLQIVMGIAFIVVAGVVTRRGRRWLEALKRGAAQVFGRQLVTRVLATVVTAVEGVWEPLVLVLAVVVGGALAAPLVETAVGAILNALLLAWSVLRLVVQGAHRLIGWLAATDGALSAARSDKVLSSVRFVGRTIFALVVYLEAIEALVGRGALYSGAVRIAVVLTVPVALVLIRRWQDDIIEAYLRLFPGGRLAAPVAGSRGRWYGFFVVVAAFTFVLGRAVVDVAGRFVLNFDQTRKALAFVFRRRLERRAREQQEAACGPLPDVVIEALRATPAAGDAVIQARLRDIDAARQDLATWREAAPSSRPIGAIVVVGHAGMGKTTWLRAFAGDDAAWLSLTSRVPDARATIAALASALGVTMPAGRGGLGVLVGEVRRGPRRVLVIDDAHHLWLRGGADRSAWRALQSFIDAAGDHVFVVASVAWSSFSHVRWAESAPHRFRRVVELSPWSEEDIRRLLTTRTTACGHRVVYDDLVIAAADVENRELQLLSTAQEYTRLVWDFADGSPVTALDAWRRSLRPVGPQTVAVRLFPQPPEHVLDQLEPVARFALAAVVWNDVVTVDDAAMVLAVPRPVAEDALRRLRELGVLYVDEGRYRVDASWWSLAIRLLRRKHLIAD